MRYRLLFLIFLWNGCRPPVQVYCCASPYAKRYHYRADCPGLVNCTYRTVQVKLEEVQKLGKTLCQLEGAKNK